MRRGPLLVVLAALLLLPTRLQGQAAPAGPGEQSAPTLGSILDRAYEAIGREYYETAVNLLNRGRELYPGEPQIDLALGDLYYDRRLYGPALSEYRRAEANGARDFYVLNQIARSCGKLNREADAIRYLNRVLELSPDDPGTVDDLGWMYFKTHRLEEGRDLLEAALRSHGRENKGLLMTLGTIYSGLYDYGQARRHYREAIDLAVREEDGYFASIACYNLSLLEENFHHYGSAWRWAGQAVAHADRSPGHLARGELCQGRLDYRGALAEYEQARRVDDTPLARINQARLYRLFGRLEPARRQAEEILASRDLSWIYYYGMDLDRHYRDLYEILADACEGLARQEARRPAAGPLGRPRALLRALGLRLAGFRYRQLYRLASIRVGRAYREEGNHLDAGYAFFRALERYPRPALRQLAGAREIEVGITPHAAAFYDRDEGEVRRSAPLLYRALQSFDPLWEREEIADALRLLAPLLPRRGAERRQALERLYLINPGGLRQYGLGLPLAVRAEEEGTAGDPGTARLARLLRRAGSEVLDEGARFELRVRREEGVASFRLVDRADGRTLVRGEAAAGSGAAGLAEAVLERIYRVE